MYIYIYIYIYIYTHTYMYIYIYIHTYIICNLLDYRLYRHIDRWINTYIVTRAD